MKLLFIHALAIVALFFSWPEPVALIVVAISLGLQFFIIGQRLAPHKEHGFQLLLGALLYLSLAGTVGAILFYSANLQSWALQIISLSSILFWLAPLAQKMAAIEEITWQRERPVAFALTALIHILYVSCVGIILVLLSQKATIEPISSPWNIIEPKIYWLYGLATVLLIVSLYRHQRLNKFFLILHSFLSFGLVLFVYPLGFGYDPFIHQATEKIIAQTGTISPKPPYYIGFYSLIIWLSNLTKLKIELLDSWFLPTLSSLTLMPLVWYTFRYNFRVKKNVLALLPLCLYLLPYGTLIQTTPQGVSFLWSLIIILLSIFYINSTGVRLWQLLLLAIMTVAIHPLTGVPVAFFVVTLGLYHRFWQGHGLKKILRFIAYWLGIVVASVIMPLIFLVNSYVISKQKPTLVPNETNLDIISLTFHRYIRWEDLVYLWADNQRFILVLIALTAFAILLRRKKSRYFIHYAITSGALIINYILIKVFINFDFLISYERYIFPERILFLALYLLVPYILLLTYWGLEKIVSSIKGIKLIATIIATLLIIGSWYLAYPRFDYYEQNKGYNSSLYDQIAVETIANTEGNEDYIVLANQATSAMAISRFGFARYYQDHFYYPVPTSDPLYQTYLDLVYNKKSLTEILLEVKRLTGVNTVYLVVDSYWSGFEDIIAREMKRSQSFTTIGNDKIYIFRYQTDSK